MGEWCFLLEKQVIACCIYWIMKKRLHSKVAVTCFLFFAVLFLFQINLFSLSRSRNAIRSSSDDPGREHLKLKPALNLIQPPPSPSQEPPQARRISCDRSHKAYDICQINAPTVFDPAMSTFYLVDSHFQASVEKIRPYPRKWESFTMNRIKELSLISDSSISPPRCQLQHNVPALAFSASGYTGNFFHDFNDGIIPLFITVKTIFSDDQDFILVISKARDWWVSKYADLLRTFSKHPIINLDNATSTHCFPSANIGLVSHGFMTINSMLLPNSQSFSHFHGMLDKAYGHVQKDHSKINSSTTRPRLVLMSRNGNIGRVILNQNKVKKLAENIGFDVTVFEPTSRTPLRKAYEMISSSHAMVGVHGAALTHALFLRRGSVFLQVVPLGNVGDICFGNLGRGMGLEYMEYKIGVEESSFTDKYDTNSVLLKDPVAYQGKTWSDAVMNIYLKQQDVRIDLVRFRMYLKKAYDKAKKFMDIES